MRVKSPEMFAGVLKMDGVEMVKSIDPKIDMGKTESPAWAFWTAIGLDVLGAAGLAFGVYQTVNAGNLYDDYKALPESTAQSDMDSAWKKVESATTMRNISYIAGGVLLAGGISLHIAF
jgi:hypothetical protein